MINKKGQEENQKISTCLSSKKGQEEKSEVNSFISSCLLNKRGQEEMVGFGLIVVLVTIIIVILLAIIMYKSDSSSSVESYQVESFVSSMLTYTTNCSESYQSYLSVQKLISVCLEGKRCDSGEDSCKLLKEVLSGAVDESWNTNERPVKGYIFRVIPDSGETITIRSGENITGSSRTAVQDLIIRNQNVSVQLDIYG